MINLYYGRGEIDSTRFMYEKIAEYRNSCEKPAVVIVPDQYTLEAERKAFSALNKRGLMNIDVMSFSRISYKISGKESEKRFIDDTGRSMLLRKVVDENKEKLRVFGRIAGRTDFIEMMGSMIQEFKQYKVLPEEISEIALENYEKYSEQMLMKKLFDTWIIYNAYENELENGYYDTEDQLSQLYDDIIREKIFKNTVVWIEGFDFFTKRLLDLVKAIALTSDELNVVLTYSKPGSGDYNIFAPIESTIRAIEGLGDNIGMKAIFRPVPDSYIKERKSDISHMSNNIYSFPFTIYNEETENISLWKCENREAEVEKTAEEIRRLVKEEGYRFKDIAIAVNDMLERETFIKRIFPKHGIEFFDDSKSGAIYNRFMQFILAFCRADNIYYSNESIFSVLETGILPISYEEKDIMENYVIKYGIEGRQWREDFKSLYIKGKSEEEISKELENLNRIRRVLVGILDELYKALNDCNSGREYGEAFLDFLKNVVNFETIIQEAGDRLKELNLSEYSAITIQLWNKTQALIEQLMEIIGDSECSRKEFFEILSTGIESMKLSTIPATLDQVIIGDLNTFRLSDNKVVFVLGVNEGIIPMTSEKAGILNGSEKRKLRAIAGEICISSSSNLEKEKLNIYHTFTSASDKLYLSYVANGNEGDEMSPSQLILRLRRIFPKLKEKRIICEDITHRGEVEYKSRINYITEFGGDSQGLIYTKAGAEFKNTARRISPEHFEALYGDEIRMSPTSMESYGRCPFAHFLKYGIRADERQVFEVAAPEMGTVFHEVLMRFSQKISAENMWSAVDRELCRKIMNELAESAVSEYRNGLMFEDSIGRYRVSRIKSVCEKTAAMLSSHINSGSFDRFYFEIPFGQNRALPPIKIGTSKGKTVYIEGRIDRIDIASTDSGTLIKVIDYKSGNDKVVKKEVVSGYKLQLMLYMIAANEGMKERYSKAAPAGVFYFKIQEPMTDGSEADIEDSLGFSEYLDKNFRKSYKMDGIVVNEPEVIAALDEDFSGYSEIIRVRKLKNGTVKGTGDFAALTGEEFSRLMENTIKNAERICEEFVSGGVNVRPVRIDESTKACNWCKYRSICNFDLEIPGFRYK